MQPKRKCGRFRLLDAGIDQLTWHDWCRTLAENLINQGDLTGAKLTLGHSNPSVTMRYSRREVKIVQNVLIKRLTPYMLAAPMIANTCGFSVAFDIELHACVRGCDQAREVPM